MRRTYMLVLLVGVLVGWSGYYVLGALVGGEWRAAQHAYNERQAAAGQPAIPVGIRALRPSLPGGGPEERCVTCHLGMALPGAHGRPFQRHPTTPCRLTAEQIGCTACHRGEPLGLTVAGAHALGSPRQVLDWRAGARSVVGRSAPARGAPAALPGRSSARLPPPSPTPSTSGANPSARSAWALQPGCAQCHLSRDRGVLRYDAEVVPDVAAGLALFLEQGCTSCHRIAGVYAASDHGPALSRIGRVRSRAQLAATLAEPQRRNPASPMPPLALSAARAGQLALFLAAQVGVEREPGSSATAALISSRRGALIDHFTSDLPAEPNAAAGALWARRVGCAGCHRLGEDDSGVPDLTHVGWTATYDELGLALRDPSRRFTGTLMPRLELPEPVIGSVLLYLAQQKSPLPTEPCAVHQAVCARCHGGSGVARDRRAVVLARRPPALRGVPLQTLLEAAGRGRKGTAMAPWGRVLTESFLREVHACSARAR